MGWTSGSKNSDGSYSFSGGTQTGSSGSSGSSSSSSSSDSLVSLDEFEAAIAQSEANKNSTAPGISYGESGYIGGGTSSPDLSGLLKPAETYGGYTEDVIRSTLQDIANKTGVGDLSASALADLANEAKASLASGATAESLIDKYTKMGQDYAASQAPAVSYPVDMPTFTTDPTGTVQVGSTGSGSSDAYTGPVVEKKVNVLDTAPIEQSYGGYDTPTIQQALTNVAGKAGLTLTPAQLDYYTKEAQDKLSSGLSGQEVYDYYLDLANTTADNIKEKEADRSVIQDLFTDVLSGTVFEDTTADIVATKDTTSDNNALVNELGQEYTQEDIDALGTRSGDMLLIGNVANRTEDGYLIGTKANNEQTLGGDGYGYNLDKTNLVGEQLASADITYDTPTPMLGQPEYTRDQIADALLGITNTRGIDLTDKQLDYYTQEAQGKLLEGVDATELYDYYSNLADTYLEGLVPESGKSNEYVDFDAPYQSPSQILDEAIASGGGIYDGILDPTIYDVKDTDAFLDTYSQETLGINFNQDAMANYGTGFEGFNNFVGAAEKAIENGSSILSDKPTLRLTPDGQVVATDDASLAQFFGKLGAGLANQVLGGIAGTLAGNLVFSLAGGVQAPLYGALITDATVRGLSPVDFQAYVDENGTQWISQTTFGQEQFMTADEFNSMIAESNARLEATGGSSQEFVSNVGALNDAIEKNPERWKEIYGGIAGPSLVGVLAGAAGATLTSDLANSSVQAAAAIVSGQDPVTAVVTAFGDDLVKALPEGYKKPTEAAALMLAGVSPTEALAKTYGTEVLGDSPQAKAALKGAILYDQGKSPEEIAARTAYTYFKEGGEIPKFEIPSFLEGAGIDFNIPDIDLGFIEDGVKAAWDFVKELVPDIDISLPSISWEGELPSFPDFPDIDLSGIGDAITGTIQDVLDWIKSIDLPDVTLPDIDLPDVSLPDIDLPDVSLPDIDLPDVSLPDIDLPDLPKIDGPDISAPEVNLPEMDLPDIDLPSIDIPEFDLFGNAVAGSGSDLDAVLTAINKNNYVDSGTPLSRQLLQRRFKRTA